MPRTKQRSGRGLSRKKSSTRDQVKVEGLSAGKGRRIGLKVGVGIALLVVIGVII
jgi:hypothetical protein